MSPQPPLSSTNLTQPRKRARSPSYSKQQQDQSTNGDPSAKKPKIKKPRKKKPKMEDTNPNLDLEAGLNTSIGHMDCLLLSEYISRQLSKACPDMTLVELEERLVKNEFIEDSVSFGEVRSLDNFPAYLKKFSPNDPSRVPKQHGAPHTLVVASSGIRAADLVRALRVFQGDKGTIGKLFAKHLKVADQIKFLKSTKTNIAVGTPKRLSGLITEEGLSLQNLTRIVIDASYIDQKKRGIIDMKDTVVPLAELLTQELVRKSLAGKAKILFY